MCITSAILPADTVHNRMTFISICLQFKCYMSFFPSSAGLVFSSWLWSTCGHELLPKCIMGYTRWRFRFCFVFLPLFVMKGRPGGASCLEPFQGTMWSSYNDDPSPKGPAPSFGDVLSPAPRSAPAGSAFTSRKCRTDFSVCVASHRWNY